jgi:hypothetical protein
MAIAAPLADSEQISSPGLATLSRDSNIVGSAKQDLRLHFVFRMRQGSLMSDAIIATPSFRERDMNKPFFATLASLCLPQLKHIYPPQPYFSSSIIVFGTTIDVMETKKIFYGGRPPIK